MSKKRVYLSLLLVIIALMLQITMVSASETEWYELKEETFLTDTEQISELETSATPYTLYIMSTTGYIMKVSSSKIGMRSEVFCIEEVTKITTTFTLQKKSGSSWTTVGSGSVSQSNSDHMYKSMTASGLSSGTYRCLLHTSVIGKSGYSESINGVTGSVTI